MTNKHVKANVEKKMENAPSSIKESHFENLYCTIAAEVETCAIESMNGKMTAEFKIRELELKEQSLKLRESLLHVANNTERAALEWDDQNEVVCL